MYKKQTNKFISFAALKAIIDLSMIILRGDGISQSINNVLIKLNSMTQKPLSWNLERESL